VIFWFGALAVGAVAVGLAVSADHALELFSQLEQRWFWLPVFLTPLGFAASSYASRQWFPGTQGSGIPQVIAARQLPKSAGGRQRLVSFRVLVGKVALTIVGLGCGASIGREGPTVQIGAAIMHAAGRVGGMRMQPGLLLAGGAAGVAAAFNTPLAGIVFAIEELSRSFEQRTNGLVLSAVVVAGLASLSLLGNYTYFGNSAAHLSGSQDVLAVLVCGIGGGVLGGLFSRGLVYATRRAPYLFKGWIGRHPVLFASLCGLGVALLGITSGGAIYGTGYLEARGLMEGTSDLGWSYGPLKLLATLLSAISGIPGGIFAPSLSVGAGVGAAFGELLPNLPLSTMILLGMVGYFSGVVQSPITAFVIVMEMTASHQMLIPLMATSILAFGVSRLICRRPVYHALAQTIRRREILADKVQSPQPQPEPPLEQKNTP
jgi:H+/Cl- antiporter ClcA